MSYIWQVMYEETPVVEVATGSDNTTTVETTGKTSGFITPF